TERVLEPLSGALVAAAEDVRGVAPVTPEQVLGALPAELVAGFAELGPLDSETAWGILQQVGIGGADGALPDSLAPLLALIAALPGPLTERLLVELLA